MLHQFGIERAKQIRVSEEGAVRGGSLETQLPDQRRLQPRPLPVVESRSRNVLYEVRVPPIIVDEFKVPESIGWEDSQARTRSEAKRHSYCNYGEFL